MDSNRLRQRVSDGLPEKTRYEILVAQLFNTACLTCVSDFEKTRYEILVAQLFNTACLTCVSDFILAPRRRNGTYGL